MLRNKTLIFTIIFDLFIIGLIIFLDLLSKELIFEPIYNGTMQEVVIIKDVFKLSAAKNTGASFSMFSESTEILSYVSLIVSILLVIFIVLSANMRNKLLRLSLILIAGGGLGNCIDRWRLGFVRDIFNLEFFAIFNVADTFLSIGTGLLIIIIIISFKDDKKKPKVTLSDA